MSTKAYRVEKPSWLVLGLFFIMAAIAGQAEGACTKNLQDGKLNIRSGPTASAETIAYIPEGSCRFVTETTSCTGKWCRAFYDGHFGWVNSDYVSDAKAGEKHSFNYFIMKAIYDRAAKRDGRGYSLQKSYSQDLEYPGSAEGVKRFHYDKATEKWVFPGGTGETMCVAAVAEVIIEALNIYVKESGDTSVAERMPADHWGARAKAKHIRQHIWEYSGLGSKGAGHALSRFDIGTEKRFSELVPGDTLKFNRNSAPGHSTIFVAYLDKSGAVQESYSSKAKGFLYFSAHGGGFNLSNEASTGLGFKREFFAGSCPSDSEKQKGRCNVIGPSGEWGPNLGQMYHPKSWGAEVGKSYKDELVKKLYVEMTGKPLSGDAVSVLNSAGGSALKNDFEEILEREMDPNFVGYFDEGTD